MSFLSSVQNGFCCPVRFLKKPLLVFLFVLAQYRNSAVHGFCAEAGSLEKHDLQSDVEQIGIELASNIIGWMMLIAGLAAILHSDIL